MMGSTTINDVNSINNVFEIGKPHTNCIVGESFALSITKDGANNLYLVVEQFELVFYSEQH